MSLEKRRLNVLRLDDQDREGIHLLRPSVQDQSRRTCKMHPLVRCVTGCATPIEAQSIEQPISPEVWQMVAVGLKACRLNTCALRGGGRTAPAPSIRMEDDTAAELFRDYSVCRADHRDN